MNVLLLDTNVVSILFNRNHTLRQPCIDVVAGRQLDLKTVEGTQDQLEGVRTAQKHGRKRKGPEIRSTKKSEQDANTQMMRLRDKRNLQNQ